MWTVSANRTWAKKTIRQSNTVESQGESKKTHDGYIARAHAHIFTQNVASLRDADVIVC